MKDFDRQAFIDYLFSQIEKITKIPVAELSLDADLLSDIGLDSLTSMELVNRVSERWEVDVDLEDVTNFSKISDIVSYVENLYREN